LSHCFAQSFIILNDQYSHVCQFRVRERAQNTGSSGLDSSSLPGLGLKINVTILIVLYIFILSQLFLHQYNQLVASEA